MWRRLKNIISSFSTYADLSPDVWKRQQVRRFLRNRPALNRDEWFEKFWQPLNISKQVAEFIYIQMQKYSGLEISRVQPGDRLNQDLHLPLICWFDWEMAFCEDFHSCFGVDLSNYFDPEHFETIQDLVIFLNQQLLSVKRS